MAQTPVLVLIAADKQMLCFVRLTPMTNGRICQLHAGSSYQMNYGLPQTPMPNPSSLGPQSVTAFQDGAFKEGIKLKWDNSGILRKGNLDTYRDTKDAQVHLKPCEDTARTWPFARRNLRPQEKPTLLKLWPWTFSLQKCETIDLLFKPPGL